MVSGSSQRRALNNTALLTANWLAEWGKRLKAEMEKQDIGRHAKVTHIPGATRLQRLMGEDYFTDDKEPITFERGQIRQLLREMSDQIERLRRFEKSIGSARQTDD